MIVDMDERALREGGWKSVGGKHRYLVSPCGEFRYPIVDNKKSPSTHLYVAHAVGTTRFKVGITRDPKVRKRGLQNGSALPLVFIAMVEIESPTAEPDAHKLLATWATHGEWFDLQAKAAAFETGVRTCQNQAELLDLMRTF